MLRRRDLESPHAVRERDAIVGLDEQVDVRALHADVDDAKVRPTERRHQGFPERVIGVEAAQVADLLDGADGHLNGLAGPERRASRVRWRWPVGLPRPTCTLARAAPVLAVLVDARKLELNVAFARASHVSCIATISS